jgi:hypothetical protein
MLHLMAKEHLEGNAMEGGLVILTGGTVTLNETLLDDSGDVSHTGFRDVDPPSWFPLLPVPFRENVNRQVSGESFDAQILFPIEASVVERRILGVAAGAHLDLVEPDGEDVVRSPSTKLIESG